MAKLPSNITQVMRSDQFYAIEMLAVCDWYKPKEEYINITL